MPALVSAGPTVRIRLPLRRLRMPVGRNSFGCNSYRRVYGPLELKFAAPKSTSLDALFKVRR